MWVVEVDDIAKTVTVRWLFFSDEETLFESYYKEAAEEYAGNYALANGLVFTPNVEY